MHIHLWFTLCLLVVAGTCAHAQVLPPTWHGNWTGTLKIHRAAGLAMTVPMELEIQPTDSATYAYTIRYLPPEREPDVRRYLLRPAGEGHFVLNEQNGILIDTYLLGDCLYSRFRVTGSDLLSRNCLRGDTLDYEIVSGPAEPERTSGDTVMGSDTIPPVDSYPLGTVTRARLTRQ